MSTVIAKRYATALLELGLESGTIESLAREIESGAQAYASSTELQEAMENPLVDHGQKRAVIDEIADRLGVGLLAKNTLRMLVDRRRIHFLPQISQILGELNDARKGLLRAEVTSATSLSDGYYARLGEQLERMTGRKVAIDRKVDPALLGGVVTRIGDMIYDGSLRARLDSMRSALTN